MFGRHRCDRGRAGRQGCRELGSGETTPDYYISSGEQHGRGDVGTVPDRLSNIGAGAGGGDPRPGYFEHLPDRAGRAGGGRD